jgi:hypothetical protein
MNKRRSKIATVHHTHFSLIPDLVIQMIEVDCVGVL